MGSSPVIRAIGCSSVGRATALKKRILLCVISSGVERYLDKIEVKSSTLLSRTKNIKQ